MNNNIKHLKELIRGSSSFLFIKISGMFLSYMFIFLIARKYGAFVLGIYTLSLAVLQVATIIGKIGTDTALMRFVAEYKAHNKVEFIRTISKKALTLILPISILFTIIVLFKADWIAKTIFHKHYLGFYFKLISFAIVPNILFMFYAEKLRGIRKIIEFSLLKTLTVPFFSLLILSVSMIFTLRDYIPVLSYVIAVCITASIGMIFWRKSFPNFQNDDYSMSEELNITMPTYKNLLSLSLPMLFTSSLILIMGWTDVFMLGIFKKVSDVGIYRVALRLSTLTSIGLLSVNSILGPKITEFWEKKEFEAFETIIKQSTVLILIISFPIAFLFVCFPTFFLGFFGKEFTLGSLSLLMLTVGQFVNALVGSVGLILLMTGKQTIIRNITFLGAVFNVLLNYLLIPRYGINGAAFASMISLAMINILPFFLIKKYYGFYTISFRTFGRLLKK